MTSLALLRHGHTAWNRAGRIQGRSDIPLHPEARADIAHMRLPPPWDTATLWASPLCRATETAELVAGHAARTDARLTEMNWGAWEGQHGAELRADESSGFRDIETWGWDYRPPGGESPRDVATRLAVWQSTLTGRNVAVCHIGIMRVLLAEATGWAFKGPCPFTIKRNRLFVLHRTDSGWHHDPEPTRLLKREG